MSFISLFLLALGLSMDAFAVAICKGLATRSLDWKKMGLVGLWFGGFQALMPVIGYLLGSTFEQYITAFDHWIAFVLLGLIGINMIREALSKEEEAVDASFAFRPMPSQMMVTGIHDTGGMGRMSSNRGLKNIRKPSYQPMSRPRRLPTTTARK